jgi:hypothetical protein
MEVMTLMDPTPTRWNDDRLDEFASNVDKRFDQVDKRFDGVDRRLDGMDRKMERMQHTLVLSVVAICSTMGVGFAAMFTIIATHF